LTSGHGGRNEPASTRAAEVALAEGNWVHHGPLVFGDVLPLPVCFEERMAQKIATLQAENVRLKAWDEG